MTLAKLKAKRFSKTQLKPIIDGIVNYIVTTYKVVEEIYLIGSLARDNFTEYSDLDFVIVVFQQDSSLKKFMKIVLIIK